jgi:hypothetical protein
MRGTRLLVTLAMALLLPQIPGLAAAADSDGCAGGADAGDTSLTATTIPAPRSCNGNLDPGLSDLNDWYQVNIALTALSSSIHVRMCPGPDFDLALYFQSAAGELTGAGPTFVDSSTLGEGQCDEVSGSRSLLSVPEGGAWLIRVYYFGGGAGSYELDVHT